MPAAVPTEVSDVVTPGVGGDEDVIFAAIVYSTSPPTIRSQIGAIHQEFVKNEGEIQYHHKYDSGDFIVSDNLAVGHEASPDTQQSPEVIGLRVMHRVTIAGKHKPQTQRLV